MGRKEEKQLSHWKHMVKMGVVIQDPDPNLKEQGSKQQGGYDGTLTWTERDRKDFAPDA